MLHQLGILDDVPVAARYLFLRRRPEGDAAAALRALASRELGRDVIGIGQAVARECSAQVAGLREHPCLTGAGITVPSTPMGLWIWLRGDERGELLLRGRELLALVEPAFELDHVVEGFRHGSGRDLTGYEDGTENPSGDDALAAAFVAGAGAGLDGSSFVAVQRWRHDLGRFAAKGPEHRDLTIGRRLSDNEEIDDAPPSAHVKRTAQESFEPEAFVLRRSMPWSDPSGEGLVFVAFGRAFDAYETLLRHMVGLDDGITDALFTFTRPVSGSYFWCPPVKGGRLDLSALGADTDHWAQSRGATQAPEPSP